MLILPVLFIRQYNQLGIKQFLAEKFIHGRKPLNIASDLVLVIFILMLLIPSTRSLILAGVAGVRTLMTNPEVSSGQKQHLNSENLNWNLTDRQDRSITFGSLKGEVVFLNQWASWCPPCRAEMPSINKLFKDYGGRVKFVMLTNEVSKKADEFIEKQGYDFPVYYGSAAGPALATRTIPATVIISRSGEIVVSRNGAYNWNARKIRKLLDRLISIESPRP